MVHIYVYRITRGVAFRKYICIFFQRCVYICLRIEHFRNAGPRKKMEKPVSRA